MVEKFAAYTVEELDAYADTLGNLVVDGMRSVMRTAVDDALKGSDVLVAAGFSRLAGALSNIVGLWTEYVAGKLIPWLAETTGAVDERLSARIPVDTGIPEVDEPGRTQALLSAAAGLRTIGDELWKSAGRVIVGDVAEGASIDMLAARLVEKSVVDTSRRAVLVARTVTTGAVNATSETTMSRVGSVLGTVDGIRKEWSATHDTRTRPSHVEADGQVVRTGDTFDVGGSALRYPGDPTAPPEEFVNCRCSILAVISDDVLSMGISTTGGGS